MAPKGAIFPHEKTVKSRPSTNEATSPVRGVQPGKDVPHQDKYGEGKVDTLGQFASRFLLNLFLTKAETMERMVRLRPEDYEWLEGQFRVRKGDYGVRTFAEFVPLFLRDAIQRLREEKRKAEISAS